VPFWFRADGDLVRDAPLTRRVIPLLMKTRNESAVYFDQSIDATRIEPFLADVRASTGLRVTLLHVLMWCAAQILAERPGLNRFIAGGRIWQRRGVWLSFSMKKGMDDEAAVALVKRRIDPAWPLAELVRVVDVDVATIRRGEETVTDRELKVVLAAPTFVAALAVRLARALDRYGLLPRAFIDADPLFASAIIAPLGSIGLDAPYHHLYEYGSVSIFAAAGAVRDEVVVVDGAPAVRRVLPIRFTLDERIADGLYCARALDLLRCYVEDPARIRVT
jgi:hypothetical protein